MGADTCILGLPLTPPAGTRLGAYELAAPFGAGGMGRSIGHFSVYHKSGDINLPEDF